MKPFEPGHPRTELRRSLVAAVLCGEKTATSSLREEYAPHTVEALPQAGERAALLDFDDRPVVVIEVTEVGVLRAGDVDLAFARDEGEGFETVAEWRAALESFRGEFAVTDSTRVVAERFRVVECGNLEGVCDVRSGC